MTKSILLAIQSQHAVKILNGEKTLELRKSVPKGFVGWVYIYVTKSKPYLGRNENYGWQHKDRFGYALYNIPHFGDLKLNDGIGDLNGKIVARFWFDEYDIIEKLDLYDRYELGIFKGKFKGKIGEPLGWNDCKRLCLEEDEIYNYIKKKRGYAWHIKKLEIFDVPKELGDFYTKSKDSVYSMTFINQVIKAPQSWMYVYQNGE